MFLKYLDYCKKIIPLSISAILLYYVYTLFHIQDFLFYVFGLLFPFIIALFFHFLLEPIIDYFSNNISRNVIVVYIYVVLALFSFLLLYMFVPYLANGCISFYNQYSSHITVHPLFNTIYTFLNDNGITDYLLGILNGMTQSLYYWGSNIILAFGISFYLSYDDIHVVEDLITRIPFKNQVIYRKSLKKLKLVTYAFIKSLFLDFVFFFFLCLVPFLIIDSRYFLYIALFLSITNLIPYIGPYIGGIPIIVFEYINNNQYGLISLLIIIILQYIESSFLQPYLFSKCIKVHPIGLFFALSLFGDLFGIIGMIFSPLFLVYTIEIFSMIKEGHIVDKMKKIVDKI